MHYKLKIRDRSLPMTVTEREYALLSPTIADLYELDQTSSTDTNLKKAFVEDNDISLQQKSIVENYEERHISSTEL